MIVTTDKTSHQVTIHSDAGSEITMSWAAALNLGSLLIKKAEEVEPPPLPGKTYRPAVER